MDGEWEGALRGEKLGEREGGRKGGLGLFEGESVGTEVEILFEKSNVWRIPPPSVNPPKTHKRSPPLIAAWYAEG